MDSSFITEDNEDAPLFFWAVCLGTKHLDLEVLAPPDFVCLTFQKSGIELLLFPQYLR